MNALGGSFVTPGMRTFLSVRGNRDLKQSTYTLHSKSYER